MITTIRRVFKTFVLLLLFITSQSQELRSFNQNASRSNHTRALSVFISPVYSSSTNNSKDSLLFRGSGTGFRAGGDYFFGKAGIGFSTGFSSSSANDASINSFLKNAGVPQDQIQITKARQQNMYLLIGPSVRFGNKVELYAHAKGGLFVNNGGLINIQQRGALRSAYRNESTDKNMYPGFLTGLSVQYKTRSDVWSFGIGADYMNTRSEVNNYDARRGGGIEALKLSGNISDVVAGVSVRYNIFSGRESSGGQSSGRVLPTVNKRETSARDASSGLSTGKTYQPGRPVYGNLTSSDENNANCGPVTRRITNPDGSMEEMTFSCPADALAYERQTPKRDFGDKVNAGLATAGQKRTYPVPHVLEGKGIISGQLTWATSVTTGIVTNATISSSPRSGSVTLNSQTSSTRTTQQSSFGTLVRFSARETGSGIATGKRSREAGSGLATGRRQYEPVFIENEADVCNPCIAEAKLSSVNSNPIYKDKGMSGNNPMYQSNHRTAGTDDDCDGISGINVYLVDIHSNAVLSTTKTEKCGDFFFANVPEGDYVVKLSGGIVSRKGYDVSVKSRTDLYGDVSQSSESMQLLINSNTGNGGMQQKAGISTSRSNIRQKSISVIEADLDGDGEFESLRATGFFSDGSSRDLTNDVSLRKVNKVDALTFKQSAIDPNSGTGSATSAYITAITVVANGESKTAGMVNANSNNANLRATATFSDGSTQDITAALVINNTRSNIKQYSIGVADLDGDGFSESVKVSRSRSNIQNNRVASNDDGIIWSPHSNIKMITMAAGDVDGDGSDELVGGSFKTDFAVLRERNKDHFETGDKPTQQQRTIGGMMPGGAVISGAMRPGNPIGGLTIKGGKNPGGNLRTTQSNENGEFEFADLEVGEYSFVVEQRIFIEDETRVSVGSQSRAQDHNSSRSNKTAGSTDVMPDITKDNQTRAQDHNSSRSNKTAGSMDVMPDITKDNQTRVQDHNSSRSNKTASGIDEDPSNTNTEAARKSDARVTATQNSQSLRNINPDLEPDVYWITSKGGGAGMTMKAQNNNTVRSNRTDNAILINDNNEPDEATPGSTKAVNVSQDNLQNLLSSLDALDKQLDTDGSISKSVVNTSRSNIRSQRAVITELQEILTGLQGSARPAGLNDLDQKVSSISSYFTNLQESLSKMGGRYTSISNVLKTKHDVAMNSIRNLK